MSPHEFESANISNKLGMDMSILTSASPGSAISSEDLICSTGLIHACDGVMKSFRSISV
jgi:hypothetical protein